MKKQYVIGCSKDWFLKAEKSPEFGQYDFTVFRQKEELTVEALERIQPRYVFFPHWNWIVPSEILEKFECVCFHTAPLPFGRGGSPVQNLILRHFESSPVCALRMTNVLDGGPIYMKSEVSLLGGGDEIYLRIGRAIEEMILKMIKTEPAPVEQSGPSEFFKRRRPEESEWPRSGSLRGIYDFIRMLDAESYPKSFVDHGDFRIEFKNAALRADFVEATVVIKKRDSK